MLEVMDRERQNRERVRIIRNRADEVIAEAMRDIHENGELQHLHGTPLQLDDDPEWLSTKVLKQAGFSHPLIEAARDLDEPRRAAEAVLERLRRRRRWLASPEARATPVQIHAFNVGREAALAEYADKLRLLNGAIRDYNLGAPEPLHRMPVPVERTVARVVEEIPPLTWQPAVPARKQSLLDRFGRRRKRS